MTKLTAQELEELLEKLEQYKGRATELITVYIPAGQNIHSVSDQLEAEKGTAKNIKSTATRKNVSNALDKIIRHLKDYKKTPENGLALFSGNISSTDSQDDLQLWDVETPLPLKIRMYRCDKEFVLEPLREMLEVKEIYGLLVMDRKEATIGMLEGKRIEILHKMTSGVPSKVKAGGQSAQRFHRITEGLTKEFYKRIAEEMKKIFFDNPRLKGIIIGGPIPTKDEFIDSKYMVTKLCDKVIGKLDIGGSDESGLKELVQKSQEILADQDIMYEKKLLEKFFDTLGKNPSMATLREEDTRTALENGAVDTLILSKVTDKTIAKEFKKIANNMSTTIEVVSTDTEEGDQFKNLGGIGAILRFRV